MSWNSSRKAKATARVTWTYESGSTPFASRAAPATKYRCRSSSTAGFAGGTVSMLATLAPAAKASCLADYVVRRRVFASQGQEAFLEGHVA
jgi:hypothetical protein